MAKIGVIKRELWHSVVADKCPKCGSMSELQIKFTQNIFVLGFPLFPMDKKVEIKCTNCNQEIPLHYAPKYVTAKYEEIRPDLKTPKWAYSGSILFGGVLLFMLIYMPIEAKKNKKYIDAAKPGDIYKVRYEDPNAIFHKDLYSMLKVVGVNGNDVFIVPCIYEKNSSDLSSITRKPDEEIWGDDTTYYTKETLKNMLENPFSSDKKEMLITDIDR
ncbi:MAG: hypothetical protein JWN78_3206 [Bacteroidota bacterium]|nr:hypothetical protein [Bacteroidota bacterium]